MENRTYSIKQGRNQNDQFFHAKRMRFIFNYRTHREGLNNKDKSLIRYFQSPSFMDPVKIQEESYIAPWKSSLVALVFLFSTLILISMY